MKKKIAIMQPYIFPYIGYFQLLTAVDTFVILDDVNFIMRGWINRNNILINGKPFLFSIPLSKPSQNRLISETKINFSEKEKLKFLKTLEGAYKKAPYFNEFLPTLNQIIMNADDDLSGYIQNSFAAILKYLSLDIEIVRSSQIEKDNTLTGEARILEICKRLNTETYVNLPGGMSLYSKSSFEKENMELRFIKTFSEKINYKQFNPEYTPNLSFLDVVMFNSKEKIHEFLKQYALIEGVQ